VVNTREDHYIAMQDGRIVIGRPTPFSSPG